MKRFAFSLLLAACGGAQPAETEKRPAEAAQCRAGDDPSVHEWMDLDTCKVALRRPCPPGQTYTTDPCGCYCLQSP